MTRRVVITGLGAVAPTGIGKQQLWNNTLAANDAIVPLQCGPLAEERGWHGGRLQGFQASDFMPQRLARKLDPYSQFAVAACKLALDDGLLDLEREDRERMGIFVGNCFGGWDWTDRELRNLHTLGYRGISPFQATAWFPAAPQGQISILFGLRGHSKTLVCDRASGLVSIGYAAQAIAQGDADVILAGGSEAPLNPFAYLACVTEGVVPERSATGGAPAYRPFDLERQGILPGEGAAFLVLEERSRALARGAPIYAEVSGFSLTSDACHPQTLPNQENGLSRAMAGALDDAGLGPRHIGLLLADGLATTSGDAQEASAVAKVFGEQVHSLPVSVPKSRTGHLYGAAGALDALWGAQSIWERKLPPSKIASLDASLGLSIVSRTTPAPTLDSVMINGRGAGGMNAALILSRAS